MIHGPCRPYVSVICAIEVGGYTQNHWIKGPYTSHCWENELWYLVLKLQYIGVPNELETRVYCCAMFQKPAKAQGWLQGRLALSNQSSRFELPMDMKKLESEYASILISVYPQMIENYSVENDGKWSIALRCVWSCDARNLCRSHCFECPI